MEIVKYLVEHGANIYINENAPLIKASTNGSLPIVQYLVSKGADIHARNDESIRLARYYDNTTIVEYLQSLPWLIFIFDSI